MFLLSSTNFFKQFFQEYQTECQTVKKGYQQTTKIATINERVNKIHGTDKQEGHSGPESLTCTMCTSLVQWKVMI